MIILLISPKSDKCVIGIIYCENTRHILAKTTEQTNITNFFFAHSVSNKVIEEARISKVYIHSHKTNILTHSP